MSSVTISLKFGGSSNPPFDAQTALLNGVDYVRFYLDWIYLFNMAAALQLPDQSSALAIRTASPAQSSGLQKMEPRFLAMLEEAGVEAQYINDLSKFCTSTSMYAHMGATDAEMVIFLQSACKLDVTARADDFVPRCRLLMVWEACKKRREIEVAHSARREVENLPPQITDQTTHWPRRRSRRTTTSSSWITKRLRSLSGRGRWPR